MAIERRVKPSARTLEELRRKRKPILIGSGILAVVVLMGFAVFSLVGRFIDVNKDRQTPNGSEITSSIDSERAVAEARASYSGNWIDTSSFGVSVYLPGDVKVESDTLASNVVYTDNGNLVSYGVLVSDVQFPTLENDPTADPTPILSLFINDLVSDAGIAMHSAKFSGAYDVSSYQLPDGTNVLWVTGDLQTRMSVQEENSETSTDSVMDFPLCGYIAMRDDTPIFVWGVANPLDASAKQRLSSQIKDCADIFGSMAA